MRLFSCTVIAAIPVFLAVQGALAQRGPVNGMRPADLRAHAITNATVIPSPGEKIESATIVIRDGVIVAVGADVQVPAGAWVWPGDGLMVFPGLIEPALLIDPGERNSSAGAHWNARITPETRMSERPAPSSSLRKELRDLGFTTAAVYPSRGILRGTGNVIALAESDEHVLAYRDEALMAAAFEHGGRWESATYPGSLMGAIALFRQTMHDAQWHAECRRMYAENPEGLEPPMRADALVALGDVITKRQTVLFDVSDEQNALRAARLAEEFDLDLVLLGSGVEFRRLNEIANLNMPIIVPLQYPERPRVSTLAMADRVSLRDMMTWEQAPTNARRLVNEGVEISLTTHRMNRRGEFFNAVRSAIEHGLSEDQALAALTTTPAKLLGIDEKVGTIAPGKAANLVVVKSPGGGLFDKDAKTRDVWVNGRRHEVSREPDITFIGKGVLRTDIPDVDEFEIEFDSVRRSVSLTVDEDKKVDARNVTMVRDQMSFIFEAEPILTGGTPVPPAGGGFVRFSGAITRGVMTGSGVLPNGSTFTFTITPTELRPPEGVEEDEADEDAEESDRPEREDAPPAHDDPITGVWSLVVRTVGQEQPLETTLTISRRRDGTLRGTSRALDTEVPMTNLRFDENTGVLRYVIDPPGGPIEVVSIIENETMRGTFTSPRARGELDGTRMPPAPATAARVELPPPPEELMFPLGEYGFAEPPVQQDVLVLGATIWTSGPDGIVENGDMHVKDGTIAYVGPSRTWSWPRGEEPLIIEANGRHVTPGLIDCHSHTGITGGVNEWTNINTAEVRIADVINPDDINWYRQLAGGLTAANQLHGSANPIGGQNSIVKLKWGAAEGAEAMRVPDARPGIKFALGENVVRTQTRYPNTRMGVETVIRDAFTAAREYEQKRRNVETSKRRNDGTHVYPVRRDLELDALVEILNDERDIHCHSYRQDEILALMRVAEDLGFRVATFQHILEGYKVAEVMAQHGAHGSAFSDWWAYKVEVMDAIPYAGAIMHEVGVNVSFNSDSSELARRMNTEAAKAVRYGGVPPKDALKFVTINPAIQMGIDHRTGSLEVGKDADFVIWSGDPLSTYTRAEQTWIEGAMYFCIERDQELRKVVQNERQRLIHRILLDEQREGPRARRGEGDRERPRGRQRRPRLMEIAIEQHVRAMENMIRMGIDPDEIRPGECGCNEWWYGLR